MTAVELAKVHTRETLVWYGGLALLAAQVGRNLALPPSYLWLVAREIDVIGIRSLVAVLTAILVGGKVASGITAELGSMKVTEQIDALRSLGVNYVQKLIVPRLLAALLVFPLVTVLADGIGLFGGMLIVVFERNVDAYLYWNTISYWVVLKDFLTGIGKSVVFGALVTLIGCYNGLATEGGTEGLGRSTTATVVQVAMGVIISDFFLTKLFLFLFW
jgi:phospholipid/cholesterol/gamma-HCH transport system permease protein